MKKYDKDNIVKKWLVSLIFILSMNVNIIFAGSNITKVIDITNDEFSSSQSIAINGNDMYFLKTSSKSAHQGDHKSSVALYKAGITADGKGIATTPIRLCVYGNGALGHANDCTYYQNKLFIAPKGCPSSTNENYFGYVGNVAYDVVAIDLTLSGGYTVSGYTLDTYAKTYLKSENSGYVSGITYMGSYKGYPKFALKNKGKIVTAYLKGNMFYGIHHFTVNKGVLANHTLLWQGITYNNGYFYFGFAAKNNSGYYDFTYIARKKVSSMKNGGTYTLDCYMANPLSSNTSYQSFEVEGVAFTSNGYLWYIVNGKKKTEVQNDAVYRLTSVINEP